MATNQDNQFEEVIEVPVVVPEEKDLKFNIKAFTPLVISLVGMISVFCTTVLGWEPLPFTGEEVAEFLSFTVTSVGLLWSWWKNNDATKKAQQRTAVADQVVPKK